MSDISEIDEAFAPYVIVDPPADTPVGRRKRRTKAEMEAAKAAEAQTVSIEPPKSRSTRTRRTVDDKKPTEEELSEQRKAKREARKRKEDELTEKIVNDFNEKIISTLYKFGVPAELLYAPGQEPKINQAPDKYVGLGKDLAIPMELASSTATLVVRLQESEKFSKYTKGVGGSLDTVEILFAGLTFAMSGMAYVQNLSRVAATIKLMQEIKKNGQVIMDVEGRESEPQQP